MVSLILPDKIELSYRPNSDDPSLVDFDYREWFDKGKIDETTLNRTVNLMRTTLSGVRIGDVEVNGDYGEGMVRLEIKAVPKKRAADMIVGEFLGHSTFGRLTIGDFFVGTMAGAMAAGADAAGGHLDMTTGSVMKSGPASIGDIPPDEFRPL